MIILSRLSKKQIKRLEEGDMTVLSEEPKGRSKDAHEKPFDSADLLADAIRIIWGVVPLKEKEWRAAGCPRDIPVREFHFNRASKRPGPRIDIAYPYEMLAIECDGGTMLGRDGNAPIGGAHNSDSDRDRNNLLAALGWRRVSFTPKKIKEEPDDVLKQILAGRFPSKKDYQLQDDREGKHS